MDERTTLCKDAGFYSQSFFWLLLATFESDLGARCESHSTRESIQEEESPEIWSRFPNLALSLFDPPFLQRLLLLSSQDGRSRTRRSRYHSRGNHGRKPCRDWKELRHREFFLFSKNRLASFPSHVSILTLSLTFVKHRVDSQSSRIALEYWMVQSCLPILSFIAGLSGVDLQVSLFRLVFILSLWLLSFLSLWPKICSSPSFSSLFHWK